MRKEVPVTLLLLMAVGAVDGGGSGSANAGGACDSGGSTGAAGVADGDAIETDAADVRGAASANRLILAASGLVDDDVAVLDLEA